MRQQKEFGAIEVNHSSTRGFAPEIRIQFVWNVIEEKTDFGTLLRLE